MRLRSFFNQAPQVPRIWGLGPHERWYLRFLRSSFSRIVAQSGAPTDRSSSVVFKSRNPLSPSGQ